MTTNKPPDLYKPLDFALGDSDARRLCNAFGIPNDEREDPPWVSVSHYEKLQEIVVRVVHAGFDRSLSLKYVDVDLDDDDANVNILDATYTLSEIEEDSDVVLQTRMYADAGDGFPRRIEQTLESRNSHGGMPPGSRIGLAEWEKEECRQRITQIASAAMPDEISRIFSHRHFEPSEEAQREPTPPETVTKMQQRWPHILSGLAPAFR